jgi:hypothetical protein
MGALLIWFQTTRLGQIIFGIGVFALAYIGIRAKHREEGRQEVRNEGLQSNVEAVQQAQQVDTNVRRGDDPVERLREWQRPD